MINSRRGFTLIEVVISMVILSFLSLFTVQAIQKALQTKSKVQKDIDKNSTLRDALRIMERDINMAFNYRDINIELYNEAVKYRQQQAQQQGQQGQGTQVGTPSGGQSQTQTQQQTASQQQALATNWPPKTEKIFTQFLGEPKALNFTSLSNVRMMEDAPMSSQAEIGYSLKPCRRRSNQEQSSQCLWRRVDNYFHDDITKDGQETVLLENVKEFKLRYLGPGRDDEWVDTWLTNERGDDQTKGKFPYAVEITIEIKDEGTKAKDKSLRMTTVAEISNPNNPPDANDPNNPNNLNPNGQQPNGIGNGQNFNNNVTQGVPASQAPQGNGAGATVGH